ncbi:MAG: cob(I)yrinic acid a,c-diamide adenosyltransferase [Clostridia bacterium]|nr:cob(I)yrinic acid a,c-diamide adenosyltransferase [Clostridia bacterium]
MKKNFLHINHGFGKGKSTAGYGLCLRAYGCGLKVLVIRFLKPNESGEVSVIQRLVTDGGITVKSFEYMHGFIKTEDEAAGLLKCTKKAMDCFKSAAESGEYGLIFLDELIDAVNLGIVDADEFLEIYRKCSCDVVISGRNPSEKLMAEADYITEFKNEKHPYEKGVLARKGIEY